jgi:O-antigen ligase/tetratricopeptide (TPR) repeat protein
MLDIPKIATPSPLGQRLRSWLSLLSLGLALLLLVATYLLMSPPSTAGYSGAIPWGETSVLKRLTDLMSLNGAVATVRGVEIKDFAFHLAAALALLLFAGRALVSGLWPPDRRTVKGAWFLGQVFLVGWVLLSLASSLWSGAPGLSLGQAALYGLALAWAISLSWSLEGRDAPRLLGGYVVIAALGAALCVWYFYERNPFHRPGFPIGNPSALAACTLPAILIAGAVLVGWIWTSVRERGTPIRWYVVAAAIALVPLCWCFKLAGSRAAQVGLVAGVAGVLFLRAKRWVRWVVVVTVVVVSGLGAWYFSSGQQDFAMARGATIRVRLYAWRYAAILWSQQPVYGTGAGSYPHLVEALSVGDRVLDPAAFMGGEPIGHAHNELFEVFAEIGLVGGVTFVAGYLATLIAAAALLRESWSPQRRWLLYGLVAGIIALLADSMFGVGLRLPGVPAVFYTLLGTLWALCRSVSKRPVEAGTRMETWLRRMILRRYGLTAASLALAVVAGWLALRDWRGARYEQAADVALRAGEYKVALAYASVAERRLLDPVRKLMANKRAVDCEFARARVAYGQAMAALEQYPATQPASVPASGPDAQVQERLRRAIERCRAAADAAVALNRRAPNFGRTPAVGAQCAEMLAGLHSQAGNADEARAWRIHALQAWRSQRAFRPFDAQTLLALCRYPSLTGDYIGLLRDVLRNGFPPAEWHEALRTGGLAEDFEQTLTAMVRAVGPYDARTDLDTLILSRAPEMYRLSAAWQALHGAYERAASDAGRAAELYQPMRPRFPELYSVALAEQAEYAFQARPDEPRRAVALLREAIHALPAIQTQKYNQMVWPYRLRLVRFLLAAGEEAEAAEVLKPALADDVTVERAMADAYVDLAGMFMQRSPESRPAVEPWLRAALRLQPAHAEAWAWMIVLATEQGDAEAVRTALRDAEEAGVAEPDLEFLRNIALQQMPELFDETEDE